MKMLYSIHSELCSSIILFMLKYGMKMFLLTSTFLNSLVLAKVISNISIIITVIVN